MRTNGQQENWWNDTDMVNPSPRGNLSTTNLHGLAQTPARAAGDFLLKTEVCLMMYKHLVPTSQRTKHLSIIIAYCFETHKQHVNTLWGQDGEFMKVRAGGAYSYQWALNG